MPDVLDFEGTKVLIHHLPNDFVVLHGSTLVYPCWLNASTSVMILLDRFLDLLLDLLLDQGSLSLRRVSAINVRDLARRRLSRFRSN